MAGRHVISQASTTEPELDLATEYECTGLDHSNHELRYSFCLYTFLQVPTKPFLYNVSPPCDS